MSTFDIVKPTQKGQIPVPWRIIPFSKGILQRRVVPLANSLKGLQFGVTNYLPKWGNPASTNQTPITSHSDIKPNPKPT